MIHFSADEQKEVHPDPARHQPPEPVRGKRKYTEIKQAETGKFWIWMHDPTVSIEDLHVYKCPQCRYFHIGHKPLSLRQKA